MSGISEDRKKFLIELYNQLWTSINTRINIVWQSIGVVIGAFAVFALTEKDLISLDHAATLIVMLVGWFIAHLIDVSFWHNRNMIMIANIEKEFLDIEDARRIFPYFLVHKPKNLMLYYLKIQTFLGFGIGAIVLILHFARNVLPNITLTFGIKAFSIECLLPYIMTIVIGILVIRLRTIRNRQYQDFLKKSPGIDLSKKALDKGLTNRSAPDL